LIVALRFAVLGELFRNQGEDAVQNINLEHPDFAAKKAMWNKYRDLYVGGEQLRANAMQYLERRQKEPADIYQERLGKVFYENYIGSIIDWYAATLLRREPAISFEGPNESGRRFFRDFLEDCDLKGTSFSEFLRRQVSDALVYGSSFILADFPRIEMPVESRAQEELYGASRAYLVEVPATSVINWSRDERGQYEWVVIRNSYLTKASVDSTEVARETRWLYYDRFRYRVYRKTEELGQPVAIELVAEGPHAFANQGRVPLFETKINEGFWLMNKAALVQLEHFNKSNALSWALTMGLFAMPVVYSDRPWNQIVGESYYIQLAPGDRFGWTEPDGRVFQIATDNLDRLKEEIYRVCYLLNQAASASGSNLQSGLSKLRDFAIAQEVLRGYGDTLKDTMKRVLRGIAAAREDNLEIDVSGLDDFDISDFGSDLADATNLLALNIQSPTLQKQIFKRLARKYLCDSRQDIKDQISQEIDASIAPAS
jgi:hypothetical protein